MGGGGGGWGDKNEDSHAAVVINNILLLEKIKTKKKNEKKSEISSLLNLNQNLHAAKGISHLIKRTLLEKAHPPGTHILPPVCRRLLLPPPPGPTPGSLIMCKLTLSLTSRSSLATSLSSMRIPSSWLITIFMWLRMRSLGLGVSEVSRAGALLRDILYRATWGQWPTG